MPYIGESAEIEAGSGGLALDKSPLEADPSDLLVAEGIDQSAGSNRAQGGARLLDSDGLVEAPSAGAQLSTAREWRAFLAVIRSDGNPPEHIKTFQAVKAAGVAPHYQGAIANTVNNGGTPVAHKSSWVGTSVVYPAKPNETPSAGTLVGRSLQASPFTSVTFGHTLAGTIPAGTLLIVRIAWIQANSTTKLLAVGDSKGNAYKIDASYSQPLSSVPGLFICSHIRSCLVTNALSPGDVIGALFDQKVDCEFSVVSHTGATNVGTLQTVASRLNDLGGAYVPTLRTAEPSAWPVLRVAHVVDRNQYSSVPGAVLTLTDIAANYVRHASEGQRSLCWAAMARVETVDRHRVAATVPAGGIALGNALLVQVNYDDRAPTPGTSPPEAGITALSISDSVGNTYTKLVETDAKKTGNVSVLFAAPNVTPLDEGDEIIVRSSKPGLPRSVVVSEFSHIAQASVADSTATAAGPATGSKAVLLAAPNLNSSPVLLLAGGSFLQSTETTVTPEGTATIPSNGNAGITGLRSWIQYEVKTDTPDKIVALADWRPGGGVQRIIACTSRGRLYKSNAGMDDIDNVLLDTVSATTRGVFVRGGKEAAGNPFKLFFLNGVDLPQVLSGDGATVTDIAQPPVDWNAGNRPVNGILQAGRLWAWGNKNFPHSVYVSALDDHEDFLTEPLAGPLQSGIGDKLVAAASFTGVVYFFKYPFGILKMDTSDPDFRNWFLNGVGVYSEALGCADSPFAVLSINTDVIFLAADGSFHKLSAIDSPDGVKTSDLTDALSLRKGLRDMLNLERLNQVVSAWYPQQKWALFALPSKDSTVNDLLVKFDFSRETVRATISRRDVIDALTIWRDGQGIGRPLIAEGGFAYELDRPERTKNGARYRSTYQTPHFDFGKVLDTSGKFGDSPSDPFVKAQIRTKRKNFDQLDIIQRPTSEEGTITVETFIDQQETPTQTLTFPTHIPRQRKRLIGNGRTISFRVSGDGDFDVLSHLVGFRLSDEDVNRPRRAPPGSTTVLPIPVNQSIGAGVGAQYIRLSGHPAAGVNTLDAAQIAMPLDATFFGLSARLLDAPLPGQSFTVVLNVNGIDRDEVSLTLEAGEREGVAQVPAFVLKDGDLAAWKVTTTGGFTTELLNLALVYRASHKFTVKTFTADNEVIAQLFGASREGTEDISTQGGNFPAVELNPLPVPLKFERLGLRMTTTGPDGVASGPEDTVAFQPRVAELDAGPAATLERGVAADRDPVAFLAPSRPADVSELNAKKFAVSIRPAESAPSFTPFVMPCWKYRPLPPMEKWQVLASGWSNFVLDGIGGATDYLSFGGQSKATAATSPEDDLRAIAWPARGRFQHFHAALVFLNGPHDDSDITVAIRKNFERVVEFTMRNDALVKFARDDESTFSVLPGDHVSVEITTDGAADTNHQARVYVAAGFLADDDLGLVKPLIAPSVEGGVLASHGGAATPTLNYMPITGTGAAAAFSTAAIPIGQPVTFTRLAVKLVDIANADAVRLTVVKNGEDTPLSVLLTQAGEVVRDTSEVACVAGDLIGLRADFVNPVMGAQIGFFSTLAYRSATTLHIFASSASHSPAGSYDWFKHLDLLRESTTDETDAVGYVPFPVYVHTLAYHVPPLFEEDPIFGDSWSIQLRNDLQDIGAPVVAPTTGVVHVGNPNVLLPDPTDENPDLEPEAARVNYKFTVTSAPGGGGTASSTGGGVCLGTVGKAPHQRANFYSAYTSFGYSDPANSFGLMSAGPPPVIGFPSPPFTDAETSSVWTLPGSFYRLVLVADGAAFDAVYRITLRVNGADTPLTVETVAGKWIALGPDVTVPVQIDDEINWRIEAVSGGGTQFDGHVLVAFTPA